MSEKKFDIDLLEANLSSLKESIDSFSKYDSRYFEQMVKDVNVCNSDFSRKIKHPFIKLKDTDSKSIIKELNGYYNAIDITKIKMEEMDNTLKERINQK